MLLHSQQDPTLFLTIARWDSLADWQAFWDNPDRSAMQEMHALAERLSAEAYEEIADHTV
jgi:heme-degrading monooxygenase HmoA